MTARMRDGGRCCEYMTTTTSPAGAAVATCPAGDCGVGAFQQEEKCSVTNLRAGGRVRVCAKISAKQAFVCATPNATCAAPFVSPPLHVSARGRG